MPTQRADTPRALTRLVRCLPPTHRPQMYLVLQWDGACANVKMNGVSNNEPDAAVLQAWLTGDEWGVSVPSVAEAAAVATRLELARQGGADLPTGAPPSTLWFVST